MMLTRTTSANRHDNRHDASETTMPHGPQPGSPTLTNPDMILPDYNDLLGYNDLPQPQRPAWNRGHSIQDGFQFHDNGFYVSPDPLSTPIIYGNGTMLSDIGEVTEVESNAGTMASRHASRRIAQGFDDDSRLPKSLGRNKPRHARRDRRFSNESTSTIGTLERTAFADFDDTISVGGDSIFQGDDEESLASSYAEEIAVPRPMNNAKQVSIKRPSDEGSANFISKRAEEILANAKQRLTDMEDNLSRARTLSYSTVTNNSFNTSIFGRSASISYRTTSSTVSSAHGRNMSENGMANSGTGGTTLQRSASALGSAGGYRRTLPTSRSVDVLRNPTDRGAYTVTYQEYNMPLEPLGEDEYASSDSITGGMGGAANSSYASSSHSDTGSVRSSIQVRDLQDQMNGLKGKISSLREQARADSLKRRSLQSLRTPSPFTSASWDPVFTDSRHLNASENDLNLPGATNDHTGGDIDSKEEQEEGEEEEEVMLTPRGTFAEIHVKEDAASHAQTSQQRLQPAIFPQSLPDQEMPILRDEEKNTTRNRDSLRRSDVVDEPGNDETMDEATPQGYESESGESLYHDSIQHQISHEDREDAFDYEHFFLHSAMGSMRSRSGSVDSNDSVETTRGPTALRRRASVDTTASAESFQTATEELNNHSPTGQGYRVYTPADLFEVGRPDSNASFHDSSSGSDSAVAYSQDCRRQSSVSHRPPSIISVSTRPSYSSFESTGTNRSFPLVTKTKRNSGMLTPGSSPDQGVKHPTKTLLKESPSIREAGFGSRGPSPAIQMLSPSDQSTVEALVAGLGQCVLVLGETGGAPTGAHEIYRRRLETARKILEGKMELP